MVLVIHARINDLHADLYHKFDPPTFYQIALAQSVKNAFKKSEEGIIDPKLEELPGHLHQLFIELNNNRRVSHNQFLDINRVRGEERHKFNGVVVGVENRAGYRVYGLLWDIAVLSDHDRVDLDKKTGDVIVLLCNQQVNWVDHVVNNVFLACLIPRGVDQVVGEALNQVEDIRVDKALVHFCEEGDHHPADSLVVLGQFGFQNAEY